MTTTTTTPSPTLSPLQLSFRDVMASVPTSVAVVTTTAGERPHGTTVSAWASLSMTPPMVLVSLDHRSVLLERVHQTRRFGVNVLAADQSDLAMRFAGKGDDKFAGSAWHLADGLPRLHGAAGWVACEVTDLVPGGDHVVLHGVVVSAAAGDTSPLTYQSRRFGAHSPLAQP